MFFLRITEPCLPALGRYPVLIHLNHQRVRSPGKRCPDPGGCTGVGHLADGLEYVGFLHGMSLGLGLGNGRVAGDALIGVPVSVDVDQLTTNNIIKISSS